MARSRRSSAVRAVSPFGRDLADQDVARAHLGADADDAVIVEVREHVLGEVRNLAGDLLGPSLVSRASISCREMLMEVSRSSATTRSETMMPSS